MKDKLKTLISKYRDFNPDKKTTYFYGIIFIFLLVLAMILKFTGKLSSNEVETNNSLPKQETKTSQKDYTEVFNKIKNNYEEDVIVYLYNHVLSDDLDLNSKNIKLIDIYKKEYINIKKDNDKNQEVYINLKDSKIEESLNEIDTSFALPENILKLISANTYQKDNKYTIESDVWIKVYNEITNKNLEKKVTGEIVVTILSYENDELKLSLDLTNLYKNLNQDYAKVIYDINFYNVDNVSLSNIE